MENKECKTCFCYSENQRKRPYCEYLEQAIHNFPIGFYCHTWALHSDFWRPFYVMEIKNQNAHYWQVVHYPTGKESPSILCEDAALKFARYLNEIQKESEDV